MDGDLGSFFLEAGGIVAGAAALGASLAFVVASTLRDLGFDLDPLTFAERGAHLGGVAGLASLVYRGLGVD